MKTAIRTALTAAMVFCAITIYAQQPRQGQGRTTNFDPEERAKTQTEQMTKEVSLSPEQAKKVNELYLERYKKMSQDRSKGQQTQQRSADQQGQRQGMAQDTAFTRKLSEILTKEQALKLAEAQQKQRESRRNSSSSR